MFAEFVGGLAVLPAMASLMTPQISPESETSPSPLQQRKRFVSVGTKLTSAMLVVLGIVTAFAYFEVNRNEREQVLSAKEKAAAMVTELFAAGVTAPLSFGDEPGIREHVALLMANAEVVYGAVWAVDATHHGDLGNKLAETARWGRAPTTPPTIHLEVRVQRMADAIVVERPIVGASGEVLGIARVGFSLDRENTAIVTAQRRTLITSLALALGLGVVLLALTRTLIVRRLASLAAAAKRMEDGGSGDIGADTNDEVGGLSRALASMGQAIATRETQISTRNRDLRRVLDNVTEGLLTVRKDGTMSDERSRIVDEWFGVPADPHRFFEYFEEFTPDTARWLRIGWTALQDDFVPVEVVLDQMPRRFEHHARFFELDYLPIWEDGALDEALDEVLVVVRDVTARVERERAGQAQREATSVFRRILDDRAGFKEFFRDAARLVEAVGSSVADGGDASRVARDVHTLKGNTAIYGVESVAQLCHQIESRLLEEGGGLTPAEHAQLRACWSSVRTLFDELDRSSDHDRIDLSAEEHAQHLRELEGRASHHELSASVRNWIHELASRRLHRIAEQTQSVARRLGKGDVVVDVCATPPNLRLPPAKWAAFWSVFTHVIRNTLDHGVETAKERMACGKAPGGKVQLMLCASSAGVDLRVIDDGRGIAWEKIRASAMRLGLPHETRADLEEALYADKVSSQTQTTDISGRGIGMGAVREMVRASGGSITIESVAGQGTTLHFRFPIDMLDSPVAALAA